MRNEEMNPSALALNPNIFANPRVNGLNLLKGITKVLANGALGNYARIPSDAIDSVFGSFKADPGFVAWRLINRSFVSALVQLIAHSPQGHCPEETKKEFDDELDVLLYNQNYTVGMDFFENPKKLPFHRKAGLVGFLRICDKQAMISPAHTRSCNHFELSPANSHREK
jgi:hypothetical protein